MLRDNCIVTLHYLPPPSAGYAEIYTRLVNQSKLLLQVTQEMIFLTFCCTYLLYLLKSVMYFRFVIIYRLRMQ